MVSIRFDFNDTQNRSPMQSTISGPDRTRVELPTRTKNVSFPLAVLAYILIDINDFIAFADCVVSTAGFLTVQSVSFLHLFGAGNTGINQGFRLSY